MNVPKDHPRYKSLIVREHLVEMVRKGLVDPTGLISQGRGEAYDYMMGEKSLPSSLEAEKAAAAYLLKAERPLICVNGNAAVLDAEGIIALSEKVHAPIEVNLFHRTEERVGLLVEYLESKGGKDILGRNPDSKIPGLSSDRALCTKTLFECDAILVPIEDGDRAEALVRMGKTVISIDLNPLSRTSKTATVPISDEITRAIGNIIKFADELEGDDAEIVHTVASYDREENRKATLKALSDYLEGE